MTIKVGDRVRWDNEDYIVRCIEGDEVCISRKGGLYVALLQNLTPIAEPAPKQPAEVLLTPAQLAQVLEEVGNMLTRTGWAISGPEFIARAIAAIDAARADERQAAIVTIQVGDTVRMNWGAGASGEGAVLAVTKDQAAVLWETGDLVVCDLSEIDLSDEPEADQ